MKSYLDRVSQSETINLHVARMTGFKLKLKSKETLTNYIKMLSKCYKYCINTISRSQFMLDRQSGCKI